MTAELDGLQKKLDEARNTWGEILGLSEELATVQKDNLFISESQKKTIRLLLLLVDYLKPMSQGHQVDIKKEVAELTTLLTQLSSKRK